MINKDINLVCSRLYFLIFIMNQLPIDNMIIKIDIIKKSMVLICLQQIYHDRFYCIYPIWTQNIRNNFLFIPKITQNLLFLTHFPDEIIQYINLLYLRYEQTSIHLNNICPCRKTKCINKWWKNLGDSNLKEDQHFYHCGIENCHTNYCGYSVNNGTQCDNCDKAICYLCEKNYPLIDDMILCDECKI